MTYDSRLGLKHVRSTFKVSENRRFEVTKVIRGDVHGGTRWRGTALSTPSIIISSGAASSAVSVSSPILEQMGIGSLSADRAHGARADDAAVLTVFEKHKVPPWHACRTTVDPYVKVEPWFDRHMTETKTVGLQDPR